MLHDVNQNRLCYGAESIFSVRLKKNVIVKYKVFYALNISSVMKYRRSFFLDI
jgi:hypothetical protein